jgi:hypothetical protein
VIRFASGVRGTITLTSGVLSITDDLTIHGLGEKRLTVSGNNASRVFEINGGAGVAIERLTITRGRADAGGRILNDGGSLTLSRVVLSDNRAVPSVGAADGGGIHNRNGAILSIRHSTFTGNQTLGGPGGNGLGGGLYINRNTA